MERPASFEKHDSTILTVFPSNCRNSRVVVVAHLEFVFVVVVVAYSATAVQQQNAPLRDNTCKQTMPTQYTPVKLPFKASSRSQSTPDSYPPLTKAYWTHKLSTRVQHGGYTSGEAVMTAHTYAMPWVSTIHCVRRPVPRGLHTNWSCSCIRLTARSTTMKPAQPTKNDTLKYAGVLRGTCWAMLL